MQRPPRVLFFGMQGNFSVPCLRAVLEDEIEVCAVVIPAPANPGLEPGSIVRKEQAHLLRPALPMLNSSLHWTIRDIAWQRQLPVWEVSNLAHPLVVSTLAAYRPDAICIACFSLRLPHAILAIPRLGCLNVHPSLLPALRGPEPLFWVFRQGLRESGVTVHLMDEGMDTGEILAQERIEVPSGISYAQLEDRCARRGGELLARAVQALSRGELVSLPQAEEQSSYRSFPAGKDFLVPVAAWGAEHVYNYVCGLADWAGAVFLELEPGGQHLRVRRAISYSHDETGCLPGKVCGSQGNALSIQCSDGWVKVEVEQRG